MGGHDFAVCRKAYPDTNRKEPDKNVKEKKFLTGFAV
jgi:hypothetical protein